MNCSLRRMSKADADRLAGQVRRLSLSARRGGPYNFYYRRASALAEQVVVEIFGSGALDPEVLTRQADLAEAVIIASLVLVGARVTFLRRAIGERRSYLDLYVVQTGGRSRVSSTSRAEQSPRGVVLTARDITRYNGNGFQRVYDFASGTTELATRVRRALAWLVESRMDASGGAALVKTVTALESLVVVSDEQVSRALPERTAHLLSDDVAERRAIRRAMHLLYQLRGEIVHGRGDPEEEVVSGALEGADRLVVLLLLVFSVCELGWKTAADMKMQCSSRTGHASGVVRPWRRRYLSHALRELRRLTNRCSRPASPAAER